ncbi:MAG: tRNA-uridine aminocarboxypropyltransferase [Deltaproteobacteria bacterium]|nr:tRNA-uridine aminocarboxypropyltransferase [Deltaproteobacteria bacterium]
MAFFLGRCRTKRRSPPHASTLPVATDTIAAANILSRRDNQEARCSLCQMHKTLCVCSLVPRLVTRTRLNLLVHYREARKPTNTGQLAARCVVGSTIGIVGDRARPLAFPLVHEGEQGIVLFPAEDAVPIETFATGPRPIVLIVPDGNWRQASKMRQRIPGLDALPSVILPERHPSEYRLRAEPREGGLATIEAVAHALRILEGDEGPAVADAMLRVFRVMVDRTLWLRGSLAADAVTGGIPTD